jgi:hypothetical protein
MARFLLAQMSAYLSVIVDIPLEAVALIVLGPNGFLLSSVKVPYPTVPIDDFTARAPRVLLPLFALYDDALRSRSRSYSFLCFYKIADFVLAKLYPRLTNLKKALGQQESLPVGTLPEEPFRHIARDLVGQKFTKLRDSFYRTFRIEIAHFNEGRPFRSDNPAMAETLMQAEHVMRYIAKETLEVAFREIVMMSQVGVAETSFETGVLERGASTG